jgi:hypothetical protein
MAIILFGRALPQGSFEYPPHAQEFRSTLEQEALLPLYIIYDGRPRLSSNFINYLKENIQHLAVHVINSVTDIPLKQREQAVFLYVYPMPLGGYVGYNKEKFQLCGEESGYRCIFTETNWASKNERIRDFRREVKDMSHNLPVPSIALRFIYGLEGYHSKEEDQNNRFNLDLLSQELRKSLT